MEEDQLICPVCQRDYELPRRYVTRPDDSDFQIVPRLLTCLHTCCQSCLEDIWEKNNSQGVNCPQCSHFETIAGVKYLPLDGSAISQLIPLDGSSLSFCSRCRDEVPSFSWCEMCCSTLCEFHHQDHKLSAVTAKHKVLTFKQITQDKVTIEPKMPPIACPEEMDQDATLYCHDCNILVSPQAMFTKHVAHRCSESSVLTDWAKDLITFTFYSGLQRQESLVKAIKSTRSTQKELDRNREIAEEDIRSIFQDLRSKLEERERSMLNRLDEIVTRKQQILSEQLEQLSTSFEQCRHAVLVAESLLDRAQIVQGGGQYLVSAAHTFSRRGEEIDEDIIHIPFEPQTDSFLLAYFVQQEINALSRVIQSLGGILTQDNIPSGQNPVDRKLQLVLEQQQQQQQQRGEQQLQEEELSPNKSNQHLRHPQHQLNFTIQTRTPPKLSIENKQATSKEAVIVEARLKIFQTIEETNQALNNNPSRDHICTPDSLELIHRLNCEPLLSHSQSENSLDHLLGEVVGQVVFLTEVDSKITSKHMVRSNYESFLAEDTKLPTFRVTREIVANR